MVIPFVCVSVVCALRVSWSFGPVSSAVTRALSSGACACAVVVILCFCVLDSLVTARARFVPRRAFMQPLLILVWEANDVAALSEDGLALLLCSEEGQVKEFGSVVTWRRCVWLEVRSKNGSTSVGCRFCVFQSFLGVVQCDSFAALVVSL